MSSINLESLLAAMDGPTPQIWAIVNALGKLRAKEAVRPLLKLLQQENTYNAEGVLTVSYVIQALGWIGDVEAVEGIIAKISDPNLPPDEMADPRMAALEALKILDEQRIIDVYLASLNSKYPQIRYWAAEELGQSGDAKAMPFLELAQQNDTEIIEAGTSETSGKKVSDAASKAIQRIITHT